jgi:hypothetical protein
VTSGSAKQTAYLNYGVLHSLDALKPEQNKALVQLSKAAALSAAFLSLI